MVARALGVDTAAYKIAVFAIGGGLAGIGGALGAVFLRVAAPASFNLAESINAVLVVVLGGAGTLWGPIIGAAIFIGLPEALRMANEWRLVVFGALLVLAMRFAPAGIVGLIAIGVQRVRLR